MKEFYEQKIGNFIVDEYTKRFFKLLRYVPYIKDAKVKIQRYVNGFPQHLGQGKF